MKRILSLLFAAVLLLAAAVPTLAAGDEDLIMSNCDSTLFWSANSQGMDALESDTENKTEGTGSVGATAINGKLNQIAYIPDTPMNVSSYRYLEFDIYFSDITWFNDCGSVMIELTSSGTNDKESNRYMKKVMRALFETGAVEGHENWWHFVLDLDDPQGTANGGLNKANFNYFRFYTVDPISTTPDYTMRLDNIRFTNSPDNYHPVEDEEPTDTQPETVYNAQRTDPNLGKKAQLKGLLIGECVLAAVLLAVIVFIVVRMFSVKKPRREAGGKR